MAIYMHGRSPLDIMTMRVGESLDWVAECELIGFETQCKHRILLVDEMDLDLARIYAKYLTNPGADESGRVAGMIAEIALSYELNGLGIVHRHNIPISRASDLDRLPSRTCDIQLKLNPGPDMKPVPDMSLEIKCAGDNADGTIRKYVTLDDPSTEADYLIACKLLDPLPTLDDPDCLVARKLVEPTSPRIAIMGYWPGERANELIKWDWHLGNPAKPGAYGIPLESKEMLDIRDLFSILEQDCQLWDYRKGNKSDIAQT